jgi:hypothetical protein
MWLGHTVLKRLRCRLQRAGGAPGPFLVNAPPLEGVSLSERFTQRRFTPAVVLNSGGASGSKGFERSKNGKGVRLPGYARPRYQLSLSFLHDFDHNACTRRNAHFYFNET